MPPQFSVFIVQEQMKELKSKEDVKKVLKSSKPVAVFFYMETCPHCIVMHKPWEELEEEGSDIEFVKVESEHVPSELGITGYPHFVLVKGGTQVASADGEMTKDDLKSKLLGGTKRRRTLRGARRGRKVAHRSARVHISFRKKLASTRRGRR